MKPQRPAAPEVQRSLMVLGLRGFPNVPGGVETHAEKLYPIVSGLGYKTTCITRSPYHQVAEWQGVSFLRIWAPKSKFLEAIVHSLLGTFRAAIRRPDVLHIHAVGPALVVPLARLLGLNVVVTHHGPDYDREKWNPLAKAMLRLGERFGMRYSNERIVISPVISDIVEKKHSVKSNIIPNGVTLPNLDRPESDVEKFGLQANNYVLLVSRFVPEKRHLDLIDAFERLNVDGLKLALVGDSDHPDEYDRELKRRAASNPDIVLTGFLGGAELRAVFQHARMFVLPSSHEGLPISLLEALSYGLPCVASDIPANVSVGLESDAYFELGDVDDLSTKMSAQLDEPLTDSKRSTRRAWVAQTYDWQRIARQTVAVYNRASGGAATS